MRHAYLVHQTYKNLHSCWVLGVGRDDDMRWWFRVLSHHLKGDPLSNCISSGQSSNLILVVHFIEKGNFRPSLTLRIFRPTCYHNLFFFSHLHGVANFDTHVVHTKNTCVPMKLDYVSRSI